MIRVTGRLATLCFAVGLGVTSAAQAEDNPVVVELYTSQGCSSCPPADAYLHEKLAGRDDVIALALHVDYWDYIGWKDIHANPEYTKRQHSYARAAGHRSVYTPQMIVNGQDHVVGSHPDKVEKLIKAHKAKAPPVDLSVTRRANRLYIEAEAHSPASMQVHIVRYKPVEKVSIKRGENAGKILSYANIVNDWKTAKDWNGRSELAFDIRVKGDAPIVVLIQKAEGGPILASARIR